MKAAAGVMTLGLFVGLYLWVQSLFTCEPPAEPVVIPEPRPASVLCTRLIACEFKTVDIADCEAWMDSPKCDEATLRRLAKAAEAANYDCQAIAELPGHNDNPCVRWP